LSLVVMGERGKPIVVLAPIVKVIIMVLPTCMELKS
jgi:hypothetical protein